MSGLSLFFQTFINITNNPLRFRRNNEQTTSKRCVRAWCVCVCVRVCVLCCVCARSKLPPVGVAYAAFGCRPNSQGTFRVVCAILKEKTQSNHNLDSTTTTPMHERNTRARTTHVRTERGGLALFDTTNGDRRTYAANSFGFLSLFRLMRRVDVDVVRSFVSFVGVRAQLAHCCSMQA
jgi:hypothetical protein